MTARPNPSKFEATTSKRAVGPSPLPRTGGAQLSDSLRQVFLETIQFTVAIVAVAAISCAWGGAN
jgi:hypothetical protein